jgi:hypothetical protein
MMMAHMLSKSMATLMQQLIMAASRQQLSLSSLTCHLHCISAA